MQVCSSVGIGGGYPLSRLIMCIYDKSHLFIYVKCVYKTFLNDIFVFLDLMEIPRARFSYL